MLTGLDKQLLGLWLLPPALGLAVGLRVGGDEGRVMLFVTGIVAVMYVVVLGGMLHHGRRRRRWAELATAARAAPAHPVGLPLSSGDGTVGGARGWGRSPGVLRALPLFVVVPFAVRIVVPEGSPTVVVVAVLLVTVLTMAAHVHERATQSGPAAPGVSARPPPGVAARRLPGARRTPVLSARSRPGGRGRDHGPVGTHRGRQRQDSCTYVAECPKPTTSSRPSPLTSPSRRG